MFFRFYNSRFDEKELIRMSYDDMPPDTEEYDYITPAAEHLTHVATTIAKTVYELATGNSSDGVEADVMTVR